MPGAGGEIALVALTQGATLATIILGRIRCIFRPCDPSGQCFQSACSDQPLEKRDDHEIDLQQCELDAGKVAWVISAKGAS